MDQFHVNYKFGSEYVHSNNLKH